MYVRWQLRRRAVPRYLRGSDELPPNRTPLLTATLVETRRVDGKPRHTVLAYLGGIREGRARDPEFHLSQADFWRKAVAALDRLGNRLSAEERAKTEAKLAERVYRPTPEERVAAEGEFERWKASMRAFGAQHRPSRPRRQRPWIRPELWQRIANDLVTTCGSFPSDEDIATAAYRSRVGQQTVRRVLREMRGYSAVA